MRIEGFGGACEASDSSELEDILSRRAANGSNAFWIYCDEKNYPAISILVTGLLSSLHYFPEEGHPGFVSVGKPSDLGLDAYGTTKFYLSATGEEQEVANESIVLFSDAVRAAKEFMMSKQRPSALDWFEL